MYIYTQYRYNLADQENRKTDKCFWNTGLQMDTKKKSRGKQKSPSVRHLVKEIEI